MVDGVGQFAATDFLALSCAWHYTVFRGTMGTAETIAAVALHAVLQGGHFKQRLCIHVKVTLDISGRHIESRRGYKVYEI